MNRSAVLRVVDTFFRRWWLYVLPLLLLGGLGLKSAMAGGGSYQSIGTVRVADSTLVSKLSNVQTNPDYGYQTPATVTAAQLNSLLETDQFMKSVATAAGLNDLVSSGKITLNQLRGEIVASSTGPNLVAVSATDQNPVVAPRLAQAAIDQFTRLIVDSETGDSAAAATFYSDLAAEYQKEYDAARTKLNDYLQANPKPAGTDTRSESVQLEIERLKSDVDASQKRYDDAVSKTLDAQLAQKQTTADVATRLQVVDPPGEPFKEARAKKMIMGFATFVVLGGLLSLIAVVGATLLDTSIRSSRDVEERLGLRVIARIPQAPKVKLQRVQLAPPAEGPATT